MEARFIDKGPNSLAGRIGSRVLAWLIVLNLGVSLLIWTVAFLTKGNLRLELYLGLPGSWDGFCRQPWGILTYMITQAGILHLFFNLLWLYFFGRIALLVMTDRQLLFLYVGGGLAGGIAFLIRSGMSPTPFPLLGASAAVMALIACAPVYRPDFRINLLLFGRVPMIVIALISAALTFLGTGGGNSGGQMAHIGGLAFGVIMGLIMRHQIDPSGFIASISDGLKRRQSNYRATRAAKRRRADETLLTGIRGRLADRERLDELLDKIRASGYTSLSRTERAELNALSNRLDSPRGFEEDDL